MVRDVQPMGDDLRALAELRAPVLSLFVPMTAAVPDTHQNEVRQRHAVEQGLSRLEERGAPASTVEAARDALASLARDSLAPGPAERTRAVFWSEETGLRLYALPFSHEEETRAANAAALRPIARAARHPRRYRLLALSTHRVALFEGGIEGLSLVEAPSLPASLEDALGELELTRTLQVHSGGGRGDRPLYHGHGGAERERQAELERFHQVVARALEETIGDDRVPLVLAATARHRSGLEAALRKDVGLLEQGPGGSPDALSAKALHEAAWPIVQGVLPEPRAELARVRDANGALVSDLDEIARHAVMGRVRRIWVPEKGRIAGTLDPEAARPGPGHDGDDLVDDVLAEILRRGGEVLVLEGETLTLADGTPTAPRAPSDERTRDAGLHAELR